MGINANCSTLVIVDVCKCDFRLSWNSLSVENKTDDRIIPFQQRKTDVILAPTINHKAADGLLSV